MKPDGGPAFPTGYGEMGKPDVSRIPGMSLRDYFAAASLAGLVQLAESDKSREELTLSERLADAAYTLADAMLAERMK